MAHQEEERNRRLGRLRLEIQKGLDFGPATEIKNLDEFLDRCAEDAVGELKAHR